MITMSQLQLIIFFKSYIANKLIYTNLVKEIE